MTARILAIDDDRAILELYRDLLTEEGYEVQLCREGIQAATLVRTLDPAVVLLDGHITASPHGSPLWRLLTQDAHRSRARFVLCSADPRLVEEQGAFFCCIGGAILSKPFPIDELLALVTQLSTSWERDHGVGPREDRPAPVAG